MAVWDLESGTRIHQLAGHQMWVNSVAVSPDGRRIVSGSYDKTVAVWDLESGTRIHQLTGHRSLGEFRGGEPRRPIHRLGVLGPHRGGLGPRNRHAHPPTHPGIRDVVSSVAVSPDGRRIVSGSSDKTVAVWDLESGAPIHRLAGHRDAVSSVAVSPDGRCIVSGSADKTVAVWDLERGACILQFDGQGRGESVAVSPDGRFIVSGSWDETVAVWDLESGALIHQRSGHRKGVTSVAVSSDCRRIVSGYEDSTVAVWDLKSGQYLASLTLDGVIRIVAWHLDSHSILAGDAHGNLYRLEYREQ